MPRVASEIVDAYLYRHRGRDVEFLLLRRAKARYLGGTWQAVHGKIEPGEKAWEAALREIREETGLTPTEFYQIDAVNTFYLASEDVVHQCPCFAGLMAEDAKVQLNDEHDAFEWLSVDAAMARFMWPGQRRAVREIVSEIITPTPAIEYLRIPIPE